MPTRGDKGKDVTSSFNQLHLNTKSQPKPSTKMFTENDVPESWEEADAGASSGPGEEGLEGMKTPTREGGSRAPPPTPISPQQSHSRQSSVAGPTGFKYENDLGTFYEEQIKEGNARPNGDLRPEKTDAVARRMIAGALGVRAPKMTGTQKEYEKAMKDKEASRRADQRETEERERERVAEAKRAIWED